MIDGQDRLATVFDRLVPDDGWPAVSEAGLFPYLDSLAADPSGAAELAAVVEAVERLDGDARDRYGVSVDALATDRVDALVASLGWEMRNGLIQAAARAYYGVRDGAGARMIGYRPGPARSPGAPVVEPVLVAAPFDAIHDAHDVVVIGAGAGGGVAACVLAESGIDVLVIDRGALLRGDEIGRDHLRNHRSSIHGNNTGPAAPGNPRVSVGRSGRARVIDATHDRRWHNNAMVVGGGTRVYQGMAWRFLPDDFRMASCHGVPDGSSLADWPIDHTDLAPHYEWVEWQVGVCGDARGHRAGPAIPRGYPMPPLPPNTEAAVLGRGAASLGLATGPVPLLLNSEPRDGRARCVRCGECVGFSCPSDAKNGSHNTVLPRAQAAGAVLAAGVRAVAIDTDRDGVVQGVEVLDEATGRRRRIGAQHVVVAAGAIETARLLLASRGGAHPAGLGNDRDQVGRHLQGHGFVSAFGRFDTEVIDPDGPGVSIATLDHGHGNVDAAGRAVVGGGVIANEIVKLPIVHWAWALPPDAPRWGAAAKAEMRDSYRRTSHLFAQVQEIPRPTNRVRLDPTVTDGFGLPVARLEGDAHPETHRTADHLAGVARRWLEASGAGRAWVDAMPPGLLAGQHQAGTCRMGTDPATSVVDPDGRVHGHRNLWVADGSVHVTNGSVNPALTIMALAHRTAGRLLDLG